MIQVKLRLTMLQAEALLTLAQEAEPDTLEYSRRAQRAGEVAAEKLMMAIVEAREANGEQKKSPCRSTGEVGRLALGGQ
ncbi:hypothetical protein [Aminobacter sp. MET-1]|uniref:hypothetical protein n=1 Tax=Aminobacter sp. MET-1 TaxID=2951085 RepID=UPI00226A4478|nr:hypothetical protein [Aminobacter sp. MET-1]MCX8571166.1 hypothetical protein [Aminobacter sp. MET-1]MCX8573336.1 hypothetical protein [Aminobacter sp. MET-1]